MKCMWGQLAPLSCPQFRVSVRPETKADRTDSSSDRKCIDEWFDVLEVNLLWNNQAWKLEGKNSFTYCQEKRLIKYDWSNLFFNWHWFLVWLEMQF